MSQERHRWVWDRLQQRQYFWPLKCQQGRFDKVGSYTAEFVLGTSGKVDFEAGVAGTLLQNLVLQVFRRRWLMGAVNEVGNKVRVYRGVACGYVFHKWVFKWGERVATPNDLKLSDGGGWRGPCMAGGKAAAEARAVTAGAVRCSAWLGDGSFGVSDEVSPSRGNARILELCLMKCFIERLVLGVGDDAPIGIAAEEVETILGVIPADGETGRGTHDLPGNNR